ncbi:hypothetical protein K457DRAFT_1880750 [Linnemannia elongata AG-77]|uniref:Uncharacterized protein n=1 Tax=Linnemannia elongata AG-77 TaxID=1314771 RepID=A0A197JIP4_9FUNG|nr:hypothetical protein K457DRAFT_1880750 [Linnemannia elongata AG-77]
MHFFIFSLDPDGASTIPGKEQDLRLETMRLASSDLGSSFILGTGAWELSVHKFLVLELAHLVLSEQVDPELESMSTGLRLDRHVRVNNTTTSSQPLQIALSNRSLMSR